MKKSIAVYAYKNGETTPSFSVVDVRYISDDSTKFDIKIFGNATASDSKIKFSLTVPSVCADMAQGVRVYSVIKDADGNYIKDAAGNDITKTTVAFKQENTVDGKVVSATYEGESVSLKGGQYFYVQTVVEELKTGAAGTDDADWMHAGGTATRIYVNGIGTASVSKDLFAPSDFISLGINVVPTQEISCTVKQGETTGSATLALNTEYTFTVVPNGADDPSITWYVDGSTSWTVGTDSYSAQHGTTMTTKFSSGYHSVTAVIVSGDSAASSSFYVTIPSST